MADEQPEKTIQRITSLTQFAPADIDVQLEFEDHIEVLPMRALSYAEYQRLGWDVPNPVPPPSGIDGNKRPIFNYSDPTYQRQMQEADTLRGCKRLLASLRLDVPGDDEAAKIAYLQGLDANRLRLLIGVVGQLVMHGEARIEAKAATFHGKRSASR